MAKCMRGSTFPRARTSTCSTSSATPATLVSSVGTTTIVRASSGTPAGKSRRGGRRGGTRGAGRRWARGVGDSLAGRGRRGGGPGALHGARGHTELGLPGGLGQFLHRLPVAVPAEEVHAPVDAGRVALQDLFDQADVLEILHPVQSGAQPQAGDGVGHGDLPRSLALVLLPDRILRRHALGGETLLGGRTHGRDKGPILAHPL